MGEDRFVGGRDLTAWGTRAGRVAARVMDRISRILGPRAVLILTLAVGLLIAVLLAVASAEIYEAVTEGDGVAQLDHPMLAAAEGLRTPWLNSALTAFTNIGGPIGMPILACLALAVLTIRRRSWTPAILIVTAAGGSLLMTIVAKQFIGRARPSLADAVPPYEHSASFPSGHSLNAIVVAGVVAYLLILRQTTRRSKILTAAAAGLFSVAMGLSRVFLGHHWFTDVLVAWTLGIAWLALVITAHRLYLTVWYRAPSDDAAEAVTGRPEVPNADPP
jgi:membrane-associated phospholipid phosphatase